MRDRAAARETDAPRAQNSDTVTVMNFKKADKIIRVLYIISVILLVACLLFRRTNPVFGWICAGGVLLITIICLPLNWKYMRCPYCDHIVSVFRRVDECSVCGEQLRIGPDGNLVRSFGNNRPHKPPPRRRKE